MNNKEFGALNKNFDASSNSSSQRNNPRLVGDSRTIENGF
jgi:hypothetical protein